MNKTDIEAGNIQIEFVLTTDKKKNDEYIKFLNRQMLIEKKRESNTLNNNQVNVCTKILSWIFFLIIGVFNLYYAFTDESCVDLEVERFIMTIKHYLIISGILVLLNVIIIPLYKNLYKIIILPLITNVFNVIGFFIFINIYKECSYSIYSYLLSLYIISFSVGYNVLFIVSNKVLKTYWINPNEYVQEEIFLN